MSGYYPPGAFNDPRAPYNQTFNPGEEDILSHEWVFVPEEDEWARIEYGEAWEDQDEDGYHGGVTYELKIASRRYTISMGESDLVELIKQQDRTPIEEYRPKGNNV